MTVMDVLNCLLWMFWIVCYACYLNRCEQVRVRGRDGSVVPTLTRMCCQSILFFTITDVQKTLTDNQLPIPDHLRVLNVDGFEAIYPDPDTLTFVLGRYFSPHPLAVDRDRQHRPICPGPLSLNHCLWQYAVTARDRQMLVTRNGRPSQMFMNQNYIFGNSHGRQQRRWRNEKNAYFCIHLESEIDSRVHMTREYDEDTMNYSNVWLETVTLVWTFKKTIYKIFTDIDVIKLL